MTTTATQPQTGNHDDTEYDAFLARLQDRFLALGDEPLFTTDTSALWEAYLDGFDPYNERQHHTCSACQKFVERFGGLVTIGELGRPIPALWHEEDAPPNLRLAIGNLFRHVKSEANQRGITGVFLASEPEWGPRETGCWRHMAITPPASRRYVRTTMTAGQAMAAKLQDFITVTRALDESSAERLTLAVRVLKSDAMYRAEKVLGAAEWLLALYTTRMTAAWKSRANHVWHAVATAPAGFCHPRASMIGTLLDDIAAGMGFEEVSRRFATKMHPLSYQRPQAAPTAGAIAQAEKIMADLGAAGALERRYCGADEIEALWRPAETKAEPTRAGVFGHLTPKGSAPMTMSIPAAVMTWERFCREVLDTAERMELLAPSVGNYCAFTTSMNPEAPPILQWDRAERRNPVAHYLYSNGSLCGQWGIVAGWCPVVAVSLMPSMWNGGHEHQGAGVMFAIAGARDSRNTSLCLFPETLRAEFHGIRSVIEAYSASRNLGERDGQLASGLAASKGGKWNVTLRVWSGGVSADYKLDRWE